MRTLACLILASRVSISRRLPFPAQTRGVVSAPPSLAGASARPGAVPRQSTALYRRTAGTHLSRRRTAKSRRSSLDEVGSGPCCARSTDGNFSSNIAWTSRAPTPSLAATPSAASSCSSASSLVVEVFDVSSTRYSPPFTIPHVFAACSPHSSCTHARTARISAKPLAARLRAASHARRGHPPRPSCALRPGPPALSPAAAPRDC